MTDTDVLVKWDSEIAYAASADLPAETEDSCTVGDAKWLCIRDLAAEVRALRERLAAQEPDATLGRLVREGELLK
jgi:hypothetical protein